MREMRPKGPLALSCLIPALCALGMVVACGCSSGRDGKQKTNIVFSYDGAGGETKEQVLIDLIAEFEKANPDIAVQRHPLTGVTDLRRSFYLASLTSKSNFIDVLEMDVIWTGEFSAANLVRPLDDYLSASDRAEFLDSALETGRCHDRQCGLPFQVSYGGLFYRTDLLRKHGFKPPKTYEALIEQARTIGEKEGIDGYVWQGRPYDGLVCNFLEVYHNLGGHIRVSGVTDRQPGQPMPADAGQISFDEGPLVKSLELLHDLVYKHKVSPTDVLDYDELDTVEAFADGGAVFMRNWHSVTPYVKGGTVGNSFAIAPMPGKGISMTGGFLLAINRNSDYPEKAFRLMRFLTESRSQKLLVERRSQGPVLKKMYEEGMPGARQLDAIRDLSKRAANRPQSPYYKHFTTLIREQAARVLRREASPKEVADTIIAASGKLTLTSEAAPDFPEQFIYWY